MPPVSFSAVQKINEKDLQVVHITAGQWFWLMSKDNKTSGISPSTITLNANTPVKFIARSQDVNHGFGIFGSKEDGSPILFQMQIVPGYDNTFFFTFNKPGTYFVRCLEYCGYAHPYMTTNIQVVPTPSKIPQIGSSPLKVAQFSHLKEYTQNYFQASYASFIKKQTLTAHLDHLTRPDVGYTNII
jgi:heme/copper-type cytochrome/quinol oxidase subunit 2